MRREAAAETKMRRFVVTLSISSVVVFPAPTMAAQTYSLDKLEARDRLAVVYITCAYVDINGIEQPCESGTGVIVTNDGYILTVRHVIRDWLRQKQEDRRRHPIKASIGSINSHNVVNMEVRYFGDTNQDDDIIVLHSLDTSQSYTKAPICYRHTVTQGSTVFAFGFPNGVDFFPVEGRFGENYGENGYWTAGVQIDHGMSGGPVYDEWGNVIALAEGGVGLLATPSYLIPVNRVQNFLSTQTTAKDSCISGEIDGMFKPTPGAGPQTIPGSGPSPGSATNTGSDPGRQPGPNCHLVMSADNASFPAVYRRSWECD